MSDDPSERERAGFAAGAGWLGSRSAPCVTAPSSRCKLDISADEPNVQSTILVARPLMHAPEDGSPFWWVLSPGFVNFRFACHSQLARCAVLFYFLSYVRTAGIQIFGAVPTGGWSVEAKPIIPGLNRTESDAATALVFFLLGMLVLLCTTVLALHLLSGLPAIMAAGVLFAIVVFGIVCAAAVMRSQAPPIAKLGPPQLQFRNPPRRRRVRRQVPRAL
jgi:hypothetical protein